MMEDTHITTSTLQEFVAGNLTGSAAETVMQHIAGCEQCLEAVDAIWTGESAVPTIAAADLDNQTASRMESLLLGRINRANVAGQILTMGTSNFFDVAVALLRPLLGKPEPRTHKS